MISKGTKVKQEYFQTIDQFAIFNAVFTTSDKHFLKFPSLANGKCLFFYSLNSNTYKVHLQVGGLSQKSDRVPVFHFYSLKHESKVHALFKHVY